jgi:hypothetical protein
MSIEPAPAKITPTKMSKKTPKKAEAPKEELAKVPEEKEKQMSIEEFNKILTGNVNQFNEAIGTLSNLKTKHSELLGKSLKLSLQINDGSVDKAEGTKELNGELRNMESSRDEMLAQHSKLLDLAITVIRQKDIFFNALLTDRDNTIKQLQSKEANNKIANEDDE